MIPAVIIQPDARFADLYHGRDRELEERAPGATA